MKKSLSVLLVTAVVLTPAFAFAEISTSTATHPTRVAVDYTCVQTAVDTREATLGDAFNAFSSAESAALTARKSALHDAWGLSDATARRTARNKAWSDYRTANKAVFTALRTARKAAWSTLTTAEKACKMTNVETPAMEGKGSLGL